MVLVKSKFSMRFGGVELMQWIDGVANIDRNIGQNRTTSLLKVAHTNGELFQYTTAAHGTITVTALIFTDIHRRELAQALMSDKPQQLIFSDEPDKYYQAIVDGQSTVAEAYYNNILTITFIVPDGIAHSVDTQTADNMPYKDVPVNLLTGTSNKPSTSTLGEWNIDVIGIYKTPKVGQEYTLSVELLEADNDVRVEVFSWNNVEQRVNVLYPATLIKCGETAHITFTWPDPGDSGATQIEANLAWNDPTYTGSYSYCKAKLEIGTTASPWSPNPADPEYYSDTITVHNGGTYPVYPVIEATMHSDNGLVALANDQGAALQFGSVDERDKVEAKKSDPTLHLDYGHLEGDAVTPEGVTINTGVDLYPNFLGNTAMPNERAGSVKFGVKTPDGMVSAVPQFTGTAKNVWTGPSMHVDVAPNSDNLATGNFIFEQQFHFESTTRTSGRIEFVLEHGADVAFSFVMRSSTSLSDEVVVEIGAGNPGAKGTMFISYTLDRKKFTNGYYQLIISRVSGVITYKLSKVLRETVDVVSQTGAQLIRTFDFSTLSSAAVWPITGINTQWRRWPGPDAPCTMDVADTRFTWVNVDYLQDVPNRFSNGDVLTVDVANKRILVNGVEDMTLHTIGNMWDGFELKPGANTIQVIASSWCATPLDVNISYREAWY